MQRAATENSVTSSSDAMKWLVISSRRTRDLISGSPSRRPTLLFLSVRFSPEMLIALRGGLHNIDPHYLCRVSGYVHAQHFVPRELARHAPLSPPIAKYDARERWRRRRAIVADTHWVTV